MDLAWRVTRTRLCSHHKVVASWDVGLYGLVDSEYSRDQVFIAQGGHRGLVRGGTFLHPNPEVLKDNED